MNFGLALASNKIPGVKVDPARFDMPPAALSPKAEAAIASAVAEQGSNAGISKPALVAGLTIGSPEFQKR
jgi:hypothetical protein